MPAKKILKKKDKKKNKIKKNKKVDAKGDEIEQIFSDGPKVEIADLVSTLNRVAPTYSSKWRNIKF